MGESIVLSFSRKFTVIDCASCAGPIVMTEHFEHERRRLHDTFYCPKGHSNFFDAESEAEKLRRQLADRDRQLAAERERATTNYREREKSERALKKIKRRTTGGVCPCCNRIFSALARHMKTKHPEFDKRKEKS